MMQKTIIYRVYGAKYTLSGGKSQKLSDETVAGYNLADAVGKYLTLQRLDSIAPESGKLELKIEQIGAQG